jgi:hypothetical protein
MLKNRITEEILKGSLRGRGPAGKPRNRCEDEVWKKVIKLLITKQWIAPARHVSDRRKKTGGLDQETG